MWIKGGGGEEVPTFKIEEHTELITNKITLYVRKMLKLETENILDNFIIISPVTTLILWQKKKET